MMIRDDNASSAVFENYHHAGIWLQEEVIKGELRLAEFRLNIVASSI